MDDVGALDALLGSKLGHGAAAVFGALWGSFWNVCIARVPLGKSVVRPGSHCFGCGKPVRAWDNVPILSYFLLRGRCRHCGARFSPRYLMIEIVGAVAALLLWQVFVASAPGLPPGLRLARFVLYFAFVGVLVVLSFIDLDTKRLPDKITLPSIPIFFAAAFGPGDVPWSERGIGVVGGYLCVRLIGDAYYYLRGREGLGLGDAKLLALMGAVLGWKALLPIVFAASVVGVIVGIPLVLVARSRAAGAPPPPPPPRGDDDDDEGDEPEDPALRYAQVPFGPFLSLAAIVYVLVGQRLWDEFLALMAPV